MSTTRPRIARGVSLLAAVAASLTLTSTAFAATTSTITGPAFGSLEVAGQLYAKGGVALTSSMSTDVSGAICGFVMRERYWLINFDAGESFGGWQTSGSTRSNSYRFTTHGWNNGLLTVDWKVRRWAGGSAACDPNAELLGSASDSVYVDSQPPRRSVSLSHGSGWHTGEGPTTLTWGAANDGQGVGAASEATPASETFTEEGSYSRSATATDLLGNTGSTYAWVGIDRTKPTATAAATPSASASGWHRGDVRVGLEATDATSGPDGVTWSIDGGPKQYRWNRTHQLTVTDEGTTRVTYTAVDRAELESDPQTLEVRIDRTPPAAEATIPEPGDAGWHADSTTVSLSASDIGGSDVSRLVYELDGVEHSAEGDATQIELTEGSHTITYRAIDNAGNESAAQSATVNVDGTDPTVTAAVVPEPVAPGWHAGDAAVELTAADTGGSRVESIMWGAEGERKGTVAGDRVTVPVTAEGVTEVRFRAKDRAGNISEIQTQLVRIDRTGPQAEVVVKPAGDAWSATDATIELSAADGDGAGVRSLTYRVGSGEPQTVEGASTTVPVTTEGSTNVTYWATDIVGNAGASRSAVVRVDKTDPTVTATPDRAPNAHGWYRADVEVKLDAADLGGSSLSALRWSADDGDEQTSENGTATVPVTREGTTTIRYVAVDGAGNRKDGSLEVRLDRTDPSVTATPDAPANAAGWHKADLSVALDAADGGSGIDGFAKGATGADAQDAAAVDGVSASVAIDEEGQTVVVWSASDRAGNDMSGSLPVKLDKTAPVSTLTLSSPANAAGWHPGDVTAGVAASDGGSGVAAVSYGATGAEPIADTEVAGDAASVTLRAEGTTELVHGARDVAGNAASPGASTIRIDRTAPSLSCAASKQVLWPPNHELIPVSIAVTLTDAVSGGAGYVLTSAISDESGTDDISGFELGTLDASGLLRAERWGRGDGRTYTLVYEGRDAAGNTATCEANVIAPHDLDG